MDGKSIDNARNAAVMRHRGGRNFATMALAAALQGIGLQRGQDFHLGELNPFKNLGRFPTQMEFMRHLSPGGISMTCRSDLEAMFGPLARPKHRPAASPRFDQVQRQRARKRTHGRRRYKSVCLHVEYVGPNEKLHGQTALLRLERGRWLAQFDADTIDKHGTPQGPVPKLLFGWHEMPRRYFKKLRMPRPLQPWQLKREFEILDDNAEQYLPENNHARAVNLT